MNIWVDMMTMNDSRGKVAAYWPEVHWTIDERDTVKPEVLNELCEKMRREIELALALNRTNDETCGADTSGLIH